MKKILFIILGFGFLILLIWFIAFRNIDGPVDRLMDKLVQNVGLDKKEDERIDFSKINPTYRFSAEVPSGWRVEYIRETDAINIYDPKRQGASNLERSEIFIRNFKANSFLTLSTVNILEREDTQIGRHQAVRYEIEKKSAVTNFAGQPAWRSLRHRLVDVRFSNENPSVFYVIAGNPESKSDILEGFISSIVFHNDKDSFVPPFENATKRVTKKPFAIVVSPDNSPVKPERFSGFHTGVDFEILSGEEDVDVPVMAICGGRLVQKQINNGYGGVAVQECLLENQKLQIVYGHLRLGSISKKIGEYISPGEKMAVLGKGDSTETDGERKHLHLGLVRGAKVDLRGYVDKEEQLKNWLDPSFLTSK